MDRLTREQRSWNMSRIRGKDTKPEISVRSILHRMGYRFRLHRKDLPGRPDIVLPRYRCVVFVHGCFWHRHSGCTQAYKPKTRPDFWNAKFNENIKRDADVRKKLESMGWNVVVVWTCEVNTPRFKCRLVEEIEGSTHSSNKKPTA